MAEMTYVCMYLDYLEAFSPYSMKARGELVTAMLHYAATREEPEITGSKP